MNSGVFVSLVRKSFDFLISEYGFFVAQENDCHVRFESNEIFLTVQYDANRSYEIDVEVGQLKVLFNGQERPFNLGELLRTQGVEEGENYSALQASNPDVLERCIIKLAELVSLNAKDYLQNNKYSFKRLSDRRESECNEYELNKKLEVIRREAQEAWQNKDYTKVVTLYKPVEAMISDAERKKLSFAEKHSK